MSLKVRFVGISVIYFTHTRTHIQIACLRWPNFCIGWQRRRWNSNVGPTYVFVGITTSQYYLHPERRPNVGPTLDVRGDQYFLVLFSPWLCHFMDSNAPNHTLIAYTLEKKNMFAHRMHEISINYIHIIHVAHM